MTNKNNPTYKDIVGIIKDRTIPIKGIDEPKIVADIEIEGELWGGWWVDTAESNLDMDWYEIINSWNIKLPTGKYFAVQSGSGLVLDGTFDKIYYSGWEWKATDSNWTYSLFSSWGGGWGWGWWVWSATSDLDMNWYEINDIGKLKIPVWTNLY